MSLFDALTITGFPLHACFLEIVLMMFGRHLQQSDKLWLVFDSRYIVCESLAEKALNVSLKLLPSLI